jgi:hypothetical protein
MPEKAKTLLTFSAVIHLPSLIYLLANKYETLKEPFLPNIEDQLFNLLKTKDLKLFKNLFLIFEFFICFFRINFLKYGLSQSDKKQYNIYLNSFNFW